MPLQTPPEARQILEGADADCQPISEWELADQLSNILKTDKLSPDEHKGVYAEWAAFFFRPLFGEDSSPWNAHFGPALVDSGVQGRPIYVPDLQQIDGDIIAHWETRAGTATHPVLRSRYADLVWDLKPKAVRERADVQFARNAVDAYLAAVGASLYKRPEQVFRPSSALSISLSASRTHCERRNANRP
jgi:lysyl-tRNA synthetase class 1